MTQRSETLRVCMLSAEVHPYAKAGGLADVVAGLSEALQKQGVEVKVFTPLYQQVRQYVELKQVLRLRPVSMGGKNYSATLFADARENSCSNYFIENPEFFDREGIYTEKDTGEGYSDNFERFNCFVLAALEALPRLDWRPNILHCHDSHTALIPAYLKLGRMAEPFFNPISTVFTIHNLAYQGIFDAQKFKLTGLPGELFYAMGPFEYFDQLNMMKAGICYADVLNTVSPHYAKEIQTKEYGCGLESELQRRRADLYGILNGIDVNEWNPETDPLIFENYSRDGLPGKKTNKQRLQEYAGPEARDVPLLGMISRLVDQKGFDLLLEIKEDLMRMDGQWIILGTGLKRYEDALRDLARQYPEKFSVYLKFDDRLAHRIEAGSDIFVMPSKYEPCGLNQMYSMRYGTIPLVRHTGGLADTVVDFKSDSEGTGFKFYEYNSRELLSALHRALETWKNKDVWQGIMRRAMNQDFSWDRSARLYLDLYQKAIAHR